MCFLLQLVIATHKDRVAQCAMSVGASVTAEQTWLADAVTSVPGELMALDRQAVQVSNLVFIISYLKSTLMKKIIVFAKLIYIKGERTQLLKKNQLFNG